MFVELIRPCLEWLKQYHKIIFKEQTIKELNQHNNHNIFFVDSLFINQYMSDSDKNPISDDQEQIPSDFSEISLENQNQQPQTNKLIIQKEQNDNRCATYVFQSQDHTLGNVLRIVLSGHSDVEFAGYSIPHPSEAKMNLRLQTLTKDSNQILNEALQTVQSVTKNIRAKFLQANKQQKKK